MVEAETRSLLFIFCQQHKLGHYPQIITFEQFKEQAHNNYEKGLRQVREESYAEYERNKDAFERRPPNGIEGKHVGVSQSQNPTSSRPSAGEPDQSERGIQRSASEKTAEINSLVSSAETAETAAAPQTDNDILKRVRNDDSYDQSTDGLRHDKSGIF